MERLETEGIFLKFLNLRWVWVCRSISLISKKEKIVRWASLSRRYINQIYRANSQRKLQSTNGEGKVDTSKPSAAPIASGGRKYTVSVALPGSIIANAQKLEAKSHLAGQVFSF
jgi:hypothetical protein